MKIAAVIPIYNCARFIRPHLKMLAEIDEIIILVGKKPFKDYFENGLVKAVPDDSEEIIRAEFPRAHIMYHDLDYFCGDLFNGGMSKARELGCDIMIKFDPDMFLTKKDWDRFITVIKTEQDWDTYLLDYRKCTIAYKRDFDHGHQADIFPVGLDPLAVRLDQSFINDGVKIRATGRQKTINWDDFVVHHFTGWDRADDNELQRVEELPGFKGWVSCPEEIKQMFL